MYGLCCIVVSYDLVLCIVTSLLLHNAFELCKMDSKAYLLSLFNNCRTWLRDSWQHYHELVHSPDAGIAGVQILSGFRFVAKPDKVDIFS